MLLGLVAVAGADLLAAPLLVVGVTSPGQSRQFGLATAAIRWTGGYMDHGYAHVKLWPSSRYKVLETRWRSQDGG